MKHLWNKGPAIWFPPWAGLVAKQTIATQRPALLRIGVTQTTAPGCAVNSDDYERARTRARGIQELSANKRSETEGTGDSGRSKKSRASSAGGRKARHGDLGRALRSVYDDTLRESVPDDFAKLLGKLT